MPLCTKTHPRFITREFGPVVRSERTHLAGTVEAGVGPVTPIGVFGGVEAGLLVCEVVETGC
jgi:hypothetical protein